VVRNRLRGKGGRHFAINAVHLPPTHWQQAANLNEYKIFQNDYLEAAGRASWDDFRERL
jgi:hypothetical protein